MRAPRTPRLGTVSTCVLWAFVLAIGCKSQKADRTQWVDPTTLQPGPIQHAALTDRQMERVKRLQETFAGVDASPLDKWVEDFKRDRDPDHELRIYEGMA